MNPIIERRIQMLVNKYTIGGLLIVVVGLVGYYLGQGQVEIQTVERVITKEGESRVEYKDRIVTVIRTVKPDGTVTETTKTEDKSGTKEKKSSETATDKERIVTPVLAKYSLGLRYWNKVALDSLVKPSLEYDRLEVSVGHRVWGGLWADVGYRLDNSLSLGIRLEL